MTNLGRTDEHRFTPIDLERAIMKKTIAAIGLAIGLSFVGTGIAGASVTPTSQQCAQARAALASLQKQADAEQNPTRKEILKRTITGATPAVNSQCS